MPACLPCSTQLWIRFMRITHHDLWSPSGNWRLRSNNQTHRSWHSSKAASFDCYCKPIYREGVSLSRYYFLTSTFSHSSWGYRIWILECGNLRENFSRRHHYNGCVDVETLNVFAWIHFDILGISCQHDPSLGHGSHMITTRGSLFAYSKRSAWTRPSTLWYQSKLKILAVAKNGYGLILDWMSLNHLKSGADEVQLNQSTS